jgi:hypothetical protein
VSRRFFENTPASSYRRLLYRLTTRRFRPVPRDWIDAWTQVVLLSSSPPSADNGGIQWASALTMRAKSRLLPRQKLASTSCRRAAPPRPQHLAAGAGCRDPDAGYEEDALVTPPCSASISPPDPAQRSSPPWLRRGGRGHHGSARTLQAIALGEVNQRKFEKSKMSWSWGVPRPTTLRLRESSPDLRPGCRERHHEEDPEEQLWLQCCRKEEQLRPPALRRSSGRIHGCRSSIFPFRAWTGIGHVASSEGKKR